MLAALLALRLVGFPFLVAPLAFVGWFASMDLTEVLFGADASDRRACRRVGCPSAWSCSPPAGCWICGAAAPTRSGCISSGS